jgi:hypothetical protein
VLKHPPLASTETSQSTCGIDCFPFLDTTKLMTTSAFTGSNPEGCAQTALKECLGLLSTVENEIGQRSVSSTGRIHSGLITLRCLLHGNFG